LRDAQRRNLESYTKSPPTQQDHPHPLIEQK